MDKMSIKLLRLGWMTTSGSSLLRMMQNISTPVLDLIVRESIQNSLDAAKKTLNPKNDKIRVDFNYGGFDSNKLSEQFEKISAKLHNFDNSNAQFLSISDTNTVGLTGNLNGIFMPNERDQHLGKLVFQIMKPQDNEGAGGSWGIGKTVYYRLGIGLIIYYSRVRLENGNFENRLVAALVEDETKPDGLLSFDRNNLGAAFFGESYHDGINDLRAITDDEYITNFLSIFGLKPFDGDKTGTKIIIPYIDKEKALQDNLPEDQENVWWCNSVEDYLKVSIARWYFPRLSKDYSYACRLLTTINGEAVSFDSNIPVFKKFSELYNAAFNDEYPQWITKVAITRERNLSDRTIGWFMYAKLAKEEVMPSNLPNPFSYCQIKDCNQEYNTPIIGYCRRPGMIISYRNDFSIKINTDEFIIGLFVLNSENKITRPKEINLDEYIRQSEKSDHMYWADYNLVKNEKQVAIVGNINNQIKNELERTFGESKPISGQAELNTVLAHKFGKKFMPDEEFGCNHSRRGGGGGEHTVVKHKNNSVKLVQSQFKSDGVFLDYKVTIKDKVNSFAFSNNIITVNKLCKPSKWEELGLEYPIIFKNVAFRCTMLDDKQIVKSPILVSNNNDFEFFKINRMVTNKGSLYGYKLDLNGNFKHIEFDLRISFDSKDKLIQSTFEFDFEEVK